MACQCIRSTGEKVADIYQAYLSAQANYPNASMAIGCAAGIATVLATKKVVPSMVHKCTQTWNENKIHRLWLILSGIEQSSFEKKNQAAQAALRISKSSLSFRPFINISLALGNIIKNEELDMPTRTRAADELITLSQNPPFCGDQAAYSNLYRLLKENINLSLKTKIVEGLLAIINKNQLDHEKLEPLVTVLKDISDFEWTQIEPSLRSRIINRFLSLFQEAYLPNPVKQEILRTLQHIVENETNEELRTHVINTLIDLPSNSDEEIRWKAYVLEKVLFMHHLTIEQRNHATSILIELSTRPSLSDTTMDTVIHGVGSIIKVKAIHSSLRKTAIKKIIEFSQSKKYIKGLCNGFLAIMKEGLDSAIQISTKKIAIQKLIEFSHIPNLPAEALADIGEALSSSLLFDEKELRPLQIRAAEAMLKLSKKYSVHLGNALLSINIPFSLKNQALDQVINKLQHPKFFSDSLNDLYKLIRYETTNTALRLRAAKALLNYFSSKVLSGHNVQAFSDVLNVILSTVDFPLEMRTTALNKIVALATSRNTYEMHVSYILVELCELVNPRNPLRPRLRLEPEWQNRIRTALQGIARRRLDFRGWIEDRLRSERPTATSAMAHLAQNRQNVHQASVHISIAESLRKLEAKYSPLDENALLKEMEAFVFHVAIPGKKAMISDAKACFARLQEPSIAATQEGITHFTIRKILCLVWKGITDPNKSPEDIEKNKLTFLRELQTIQNQYGPGHPSCMGGTINQLTSILEGSDPDVQIVRLDKGLLSDTYKELMIETFMQAPLPVQQALLKVEEQSLTPFLEKMRNSFQRRLTDMNATIDKRGIVFKNTKIMETTELEYLISKDFLQEQLTISPGLVKAIVAEVVKKNAAPLSAEKRKILCDPKHALCRQTLSPFAEGCRKEVLERLTKDFGASFANSKGDLCYNGESIIPGEEFHKLLEDDEFRKAL